MTKSLYDEPLCPICHRKMVWNNLISITSYTHLGCSDCSFLLYSDTSRRVTYAYKKLVETIENGPKERCEIAKPDCKIVTNYDADGIPFCKRCWDEFIKPHIVANGKKETSKI